MRVTGVIKEYVRNEILKKGDEKLKEVEKEYKENKEKCRVEADEYMENITNNIIYPQICTIFRKYGMTVPTYEDFKYSLYTYKFHYSIGNTEKENNIRAENIRIRNKENEIINNILIELELGAKKSELKEMLEKVEL